MPRFYKTFTLSTYLMAFVGALTLAVSAREPLLLATTVIVMVVLWRAEVRGKVVLKKNAGTWLAILCVWLLQVDATAVSGNWPLALAHFILLIQFIKLAGPKTDRDYAQIYVISLMHLAVSAVLTIDLSFSLTFTSYMVAALWTLVLFHLKRKGEAAATLRPPGEADEPIFPPRMLTTSFYFSTAVISLVTLLLTGIIFLAIPRFGAKIFGIGSRTRQNITGFSDHFGFEDLGAIAESEEIVLRVTLESGTIPPEGLYMRGLTYAWYKDGEWLRAPDDLRDIAVNLGGKISNKKVRFNLHDRAAGGDIIVQEVRREPISSRALFAFKEPVRYDFSSREAPRILQKDALGNYICPGSPGGTVKYTVRSRVFNNYEGLADAYAPRYRIRGNSLAQPVDYTLLPDLPKAPTWKPDIQRLAAKIVRDAGAKTPYEKVLAIRAYLMDPETFSYTLNVTHDPGREAIHEFLFTTQKGHCELFASAMVLLLRAEGIPCRVVTGFTGGELNSWAEPFFIFRQKHAHAWVEVHFDNDYSSWNEDENPFGWVTFDPTPAAMVEHSNSFWGYLTLTWLDWVITYNYSDQEEITETVATGIGSIGRFFKDLAGGAVCMFDSIRDFKSFARFVGFLLIALILIIFGTMYYFNKFKRKNKKTVRRKSTIWSVVRFYAEFQRALARYGRKRRPSQTPSEFLWSLGLDPHIPFGEAELITNTFLRVRYGGMAPDTTEMTAAEQALNNLKTALKKPTKVPNPN